MVGGQKRPETQSTAVPAVWIVAGASLFCGGLIWWAVGARQANEREAEAKARDDDAIRAQRVAMFEAGLAEERRRAAAPAVATSSSPAPFSPPHYDRKALRAGILAAVPELRRHVAAGRSKARVLTSACLADLRERQGRANAIQAENLPEGAILGEEDELDAADALLNALLDTRSCVDCDPRDISRCDTADSSLRKAETLARKL